MPLSDGDGGDGDGGGGGDGDGDGGDGDGGDHGCRTSGRTVGAAAAAPCASPRHRAHDATLVSSPRRPSNGCPMQEHAPSTERNRDAILVQLQRFLPRTGCILEIASGSGQHAVYFTPHFPAATWQPTDRSPAALSSIRAWADEAGIANLAAPLQLDVTWAHWPIADADAMVNINMLHISPWSACRGLFAGAARTLVPGAPLIYYGAFIRADRATAPSNLEFDRSLRARDPAWGVRRLEDVVEVADEFGLALEAVVDMPNNNFVVVFRSARA
jgi:hypothetical protein